METFLEFWGFYSYRNSSFSLNFVLRKYCELLLTYQGQAGARCTLWSCLNMKRLPAWLLIIREKWFLATLFDSSEGSGLGGEVFQYFYHLDGDLLEFTARRQDSHPQILKIVVKGLIGTALICTRHSPQQSDDKGEAHFKSCYTLPEDSQEALWPALEGAKPVSVGRGWESCDSQISSISNN